MIIFALENSGEKGIDIIRNTLCDIYPDSKIYSFDKPHELLQCAGRIHADIVFIDIDAFKMSGFITAGEVRNIIPDIKNVFVLDASNYKDEAFSIYSGSYIIKPISEEAVMKEIEKVIAAEDSRYASKIYVQTFGNFEVFSSGIPLKFSRAKTKELFAYLVHRYGAWCSNAEIIAVLWEDASDSRAIKSYLRNLISDLQNTLKNACSEDIIRKERGMISVAESRIRCDYYEYCKGMTTSYSQYRGEYMAQYSWAEYMNAYLEAGGKSMFPVSELM